MYHAYLHGTDESLTLLASHPSSAEWVIERAEEWLGRHEPDSEARVVISEVKMDVDAGDFVMNAALLRRFFADHRPYGKVR